MNDLNIAVEMKADQETSWFQQGEAEGRRGKFRPSHPELVEWYQGWSEGYQQYCLQTQHLVEYGGHVTNQGYLCVPYEEIKAQFGEMSQIEDYDGWELYIDFLSIELITFDSEEPKSEKAWHINCDNVQALRVLGDIFGMERISIKRPMTEVEDIFGHAA